MQDSNSTPTPNPGKPMHRFQVAFTEGTFQKLKALAPRLNVRSRADVLLKGIALLEIFCDAQAQGAEFIIRSPDGTEHRLVSI